MHLAEMSARQLVPSSLPKTVHILSPNVSKWGKFTKKNCTRSHEITAYSTYLRCLNRSTIMPAYSQDHDSFRFSQYDDEVEFCATGSIETVPFINVREG